MTDRVIFRTWKKAPQTVVALLPDVPANPGRVMMYEHVGQHGEGDPAIIQDTRPAKEEEYLPLLKELHNRGYKLRVLKRLRRS